MSRMDNLKTFCAFSITVSIYTKWKHLNVLETLRSQVELDVKQNNNKNGDFFFFLVNNLLVLFTICCTGPKW